MMENAFQYYQAANLVNVVLTVQPSPQTPWIQIERVSTLGCTSQELVRMPLSKHPSQYRNCFLRASLTIWDGVCSQLVPRISPLSVCTKQSWFSPGMEQDAFKFDLMENGKNQEKEQLKRRIDSLIQLVQYSQLEDLMESLFVPAVFNRQLTDFERLLGTDADSAKGIL